jgi:predicted PurR-regulated permease PerM
MKSSFIQRYFFAAVLFIAFGLGFLLFWPFLVTIILAGVFAVLLYPLFRFFHKYIKSSGFSSFLTILCFFIILCIPIFFIGVVLVKQSQSMYMWLTQHGSLNAVIDHLNALLHRWFPTVSFNLESKVDTFVVGLSSKLTTVFTGTIATVASFFLMLLTMFYFLKDGIQMKESALALSPLSAESNLKIIAVLRKSINGIIKGYFVIGLAQGIVTGIGLFVFGVPHAVLWGLFAAIASLIPNIGTALISVPVIIFLFLNNQVGAAIGFAAWAVFLSGTVDNILNPFVVGRQIAIHPILVLFSVLGGVALMGPVGLIIGPLIISFIYALVSVYKHEMTGEEPVA